MMPPSGPQNLSSVSWPWPLTFSALEIFLLMRYINLRLLTSNPQNWLFYDLAPWTTCANWHQTQYSFSKYRVHESGNGRTNGEHWRRHNKQCKAQHSRPDLATFARCRYRSFAAFWPSELDFDLVRPKIQWHHLTTMSGQFWKFDDDRLTISCNTTLLTNKQTHSCKISLRAQDSFKSLRKRTTFSRHGHQRKEVVLLADRTALQCGLR